MELPQINSVWRHHSGRLYEVEELRNVETTNPHKYPITVCYRGANGKKWCKPLENWHTTMTFVRKGHSRFWLVTALCMLVSAFQMTLAHLFDATTPIQASFCLLGGALMALTLSYLVKGLTLVWAKRQEDK